MNPEVVKCARQRVLGLGVRVTNLHSTLTLFLTFEGVSSTVALSDAQVFEALEALCDPNTYGVLVSAGWAYGFAQGKGGG